MVRFNLNPDAVTTTGEVAVSDNVEMFPAYPNPAANNTTIRYNLNQASKVTFELRDVTGKLVEVRDMGTQASGQNNIVLETATYGAGSYTVTLMVNGARITQKLMIQ